MIEALIALAVAGSCWERRSRRGAARWKRRMQPRARSLLESLTRSISHAALTGSEVVLCPGELPAAAGASIDWSRGWIAYADIDGDRRRDANETLLHASRR